MLLGVGISGSSTLLLADRAGLKNRVGKKDKIRGGVKIHLQSQDYLDCLLCSVSCVLFLLES